MKKAIFLTLLTLSLTTAPLMATPCEAASIRQTTIERLPSADNSVLAEETQWYYRVVDGRVQRRLWSISYSKWLTDWEWV